MDESKLLQVRLVQSKWYPWTLLGITLFLVTEFCITVICIQIGRWIFRFDINRLDAIRKFKQEEHEFNMTLLDI